MQIKFFVEAEEINNATKLVYESLQVVDGILLKTEEKNVEPYWKMKDVYVVEFNIELYQGTLQCFLDNYCDVWIKLGYPVDELLASRDNEECKYMKDGFIMINLFL